MIKIDLESIGENSGGEHVFFCDTVLLSQCSESMGMKSSEFFKPFF